MSRAAQLDCQHERSCALVLTLFLFQKGQGFFPPLLIAALLPRSRRGANLPLAGGTLRYDLDIFASQKASVVSNPRWHFYASHEACRRMAVYISQLTGNRTRPASREACRRAAVALRLTSMSPEHPARHRRAVRG